jgi:hypothetical protein
LLNFLRGYSTVSTVDSWIGPIGGTTEKGLKNLGPQTPPTGNLFFIFLQFARNLTISERSEAEGGARSKEKQRAEGPEVRPLCKALGYWDDKSEEKLLRTTTDGLTGGRSKMTRSHMGIPPNFSFFANF